MTTGTGKDLRHKQEIQITKERMSKFKNIIIMNLQSGNNTEGSKS